MKRKNEEAISIAEAAEIIGNSPQFVRIAMQRGILDIGVCVQMSSIWTYNISYPKLAAYTGKTIEEIAKQIKEIRIRNEKDKRKVG